MQTIYRGSNWRRSIACSAKIAQMSVQWRASSLYAFLQGAGFKWYKLPVPPVTVLMYTDVWWWDGRHVHFVDILSNSCSISQFLSLHLHSPYLPVAFISVQTLCPLSPLNIQRYFSDVDHLDFFRCIPVTHRRAYTPAAVIQFVLTQSTRLSQHFSYLLQDSYNRWGPSSRGILRVISVTTVMSSCDSTQHFFDQYNKLHFQYHKLCMFVLFYCQIHKPDKKPCFELNHSTLFSGSCT